MVASSVDHFGHVRPRDHTLQLCLERAGDCSSHRTRPLFLGKRCKRTRTLVGSCGPLPAVFTNCVYFDANVGVVGRVVAVKTAHDEDSFQEGGTTLLWAVFWMKGKRFPGLRTRRVFFEWITPVASFVHLKTDEVKFTFYKKCAIIIFSSYCLSKWLNFIQIFNLGTQRC